MNPAALETSQGLAAVGHHSTLLNSTVLEIAFFFFFVSKPPSAFYQAVFPLALLCQVAGSSTSYTGSKKIHKKHLTVEELDRLPAILLPMLKRPTQKSSATVMVVAGAFGSTSFKIGNVLQKWSRFLEIAKQA